MNKKIYIVTNLITGKQYVGQTKRSIEFRLSEHIATAKLNKYNNRFYNAINKYGEDNFKIELLEDNIATLEEANERERFWINYYDTYNNGYNSTIGGDGVPEYHHLEETKQKISKSLKGHVFPESRNEKIRQAMLGRDMSIEWRNKISEVAKRRIGAKNPFYGRHHTEETKAQYRDSMDFNHVARLDPNTLEVLQIYETSTFAAEWVIANNLSTAKIGTCRGRINLVCKAWQEKQTAYGYCWKIIKRCND